MKICSSYCMTMDLTLPFCYIFRMELKSAGNYVVVMVIYAVVGFPSYLLYIFQHALMKETTLCCNYRYTVVSFFLLFFLLICLKQGELYFCCNLFDASRLPGSSWRLSRSWVLENPCLVQLHTWGRQSICCNVTRVLKNVSVGVIIFLLISCEVRFVCVMQLTV